MTQIRIALLAACVLSSAPGAFISAPAPAAQDSPLQAPQQTAQQTQSQAPTRLVTGRVVDGTSTRGVSEAVVRLRARSGTPYFKTALTDPSGNFVFFDVPDGAYDLEASKTGHWFGVFGQKLPGERGRFLTVNAAEKLVALTVPIWRFASISGMVTNEHGEPVVGSPVHVMIASNRAGRAGWTPQSSSVVTDDRGAFTIGELYRGQYLVYVPPSRSPIEIGGLPFIYPLTIHPAATTLAAAAPIDVESGDERTGINLQLRPAAARRLSGRVLVFPAARTQVRLTLSDEATGMQVELATTRSEPDGRFVFPAVAPGSYQVSMPQPGQTGPSFAAVGDPDPGFTQRQSQMFVSVPVIVSDTDVLDVLVAAPANLEIAGRLQFANNATTKPPALRQIGVTISSASGTMREFVTTDDQGAFRMPVPAGSYFVRPLVIPTGWRLESITSSGRDALDSPVVLADQPAADIVITLTDKMTTVSGSVLAGDGRTLAAAEQNATVAIFPVAQSLWIDFGGTHPRFLNVRVNPDGAFTARGLPEGDYYAVALPDDITSGWMEQATLARLAKQATRVRVTAGASDPSSLALRVVKGR